MCKLKIYYLLTVLFLSTIFTPHLQAQVRDSLFINSSSDSLFVSNSSGTDTMAIFGNVEHRGVWGTAANSYIYFLGSVWKNASTASFINFTANNPAATQADGGVFCLTPANGTLQTVQGGFNRQTLSGPIFPNLQVANPYNIFLDSSDLAVLNTVQMDAGLVYLFRNTHQSFVIGGGNNKPLIKNYSSARYFVTGTTPDKDSSYFYVRNVAAADSVIFPIGSKAGDFTPAGITNRASASSDYMSRVFDGVYQNGASGPLLTDTKYLQKTWYVATPNTHQSFVIGGGSNKPLIKNYSSARYFVTGTTPDKDSSYFYVRNVAAADSVIFPIGSKAGDFTPAGITNRASASSDYMSRVFDGVYQDGASGPLITDTTYLQKTWYVATPNALNSSYLLNLQHHLADESAPFTHYRPVSFISKNNGPNLWDTLNPITPVTTASLYPNLGNRGDSIFYNWRILDNILHASQGNYFTKMAIKDNDSLYFDKSVVGTPQPDATDGSYNIVYKFTVDNFKALTLTQFTIGDNLAKTFPSPAQFSVKSIYSAKGILTANPQYDGVSDTLLVKNENFLTGKFDSDTLYLLVNLNLNSTKDTLFRNTGWVDFFGSNGRTTVYNKLFSVADVIIKPMDVIIPDGFSPNGDGLNDRFVIGHPATKKIGLIAYNRWGNIVFQRAVYQNEWDGKGVNNFLGKDLEEGTYYVLVTITDSITGAQQKVVKFITLRRSY